MNQEVPGGGSLQVPAIGRHAVLDLLAPAALVEGELGEIGIGELHHVGQDLLELLVISDGHPSYLD